MSSDLSKAKEDLFKVIAELKTPEDVALFLEDLCTYKEVDSMAQRIAAARLLLDGETYEKIIKETDISSATLSRVSRCVKYGNGYKKILSKK